MCCVTGRREVVRRAAQALCALAGAALPAAAWAHSPVPGLGHFYNGMLHPLLAPAPLIALLALGLLFGQRGLVTARPAVLAFVVALGASLGLGMGADLERLATGAGLLLAGAVTAAVTLTALRLAPVPLATLAAVVGAAAGLGLSDMPADGDRWVVVAGTWLGAALCTLTIAAVAELGARPWQQMAVRVVASWLAASALLVLGLMWARPPGALS